MVTCAVAAFEYAAAQVGATNFQGEWAALAAYGKVLSIDCPFAVFLAEELVYPQYNLRSQMEEMIAKWTPWAQERARERLAEHEATKGPAAKRVIEHWKHLAEGGQP